MKPVAFLTGAEAIAKERQRQIEKLQYGVGHDDLHTAEELAFAAAAYATPAGWTVELHPGGKARTAVIKNALYPWRDRSLEMNVPDGKRPMKEYLEKRQRELVKAGALIAAEYDRLERVKAKQ